MGNSIQDMIKAKTKETPKPVPVQPPAQQPQVKKEDRFCTLNFHYRFRAPDGSVIAPDVGGIYHPKSKEEEAELAYQVTQGRCYKESMLVPPLEE